MEPEDNNTGEELPPAGHPAWQEIVGVLPEELQSLITPKLKEWDDKIQGKFSEVHEQYDPYKPLIDNSISIDQVEQALYVAHMLENDPATLIQNAIEHFNLEQFQLVDPEENNNDGEESYEMTDGELSLEALRKNPQFKEFFERQDQIAAYVESQQASAADQQASQQVSEYLESLHGTVGEFDDLYVTALMAQGFDGEKAAKQFQETVSQAAAKLNPQPAVPPVVAPIVIGSSGTTGSGIPNEPVSLGAMKNSEVTDLVTQYLQNAQSNS